MLKSNMEQRVTRSRDKKNKEAPAISKSSQIDGVDLSIRQERTSESSSAQPPSSQPESQMAKRKALPAKTTPSKTPRKSKWSAERILSDPKSPLASVNLRNLLCDPSVWQLLDSSDQDEIVALFPDNIHLTQTEDGRSRPNFESLRNDDSFRHDCAAYTENLARGSHDPEWLASAWAAHEMRKVGEFDGHLATKFEEEWGVQMPGQANGDVSQ